VVADSEGKFKTKNKNGKIEILLNIELVLRPMGSKLKFNMQLHREIVDGSKTRSNRGLE
jgi:hypothetical protein